MHPLQGYFAPLLTTANLTQLQGIVTQSFELVTEHWSPKESGYGVYFRAGFFVQSPQGYVPFEFLRSWIGGEANQGKEDNFRAFSAEKPYRLAQRLHLRHQSIERDLAYKGCFCLPIHCTELSANEEETGLLYLSASGLEEDSDEASCVQTADMLGQRGWCDFEDTALQNILQCKRRR